MTEEQYRRASELKKSIQNLTNVLDMLELKGKAYLTYTAELPNGRKEDINVSLGDFSDTCLNVVRASFRMKLHAAKTELEAL